MENAEGSVAGIQTSVTALYDVQIPLSSNFVLVLTVI